MKNVLPPESVKPQIQAKSFESRNLVGTASLLLALFGTAFPILIPVALVLSAYDLHRIASRGEARPRGLDVAAIAICAIDVLVWLPSLILPNLVQALGPYGLLALGALLLVFVLPPIVIGGIVLVVSKWVTRAITGQDAPYIRWVPWLLAVLAALAWLAFVWSRPSGCPLISVFFSRC